jgi:threonine dehydrogenase-like Zn-dependent dehydrogenase
VRQLQFIAPGKVEWRDAPDPKIEADDDAVVRPLAVATCDLDTAVLRGQAPLQGPFALGHEFVGELVDGGDAVGDFEPGARVVVPFQIACGECDFCRRGVTSGCERAPGNAMYGVGALGGEWGGALADLVRVPFAPGMLVPLPDGVAPATAASASDNIADAWRTVAEPLAERPGAEVLIVGGGAQSISLYAVQIANALGASKIDFVDEDAGRLELAAALGANPIDVPPPKRLGPYPITVDASSTHDGLHRAIRSTEPGGTCTSVSIFFEPETPVPLLSMYTKGIVFKTSRVDSRAALPEVLDLIASGRLDPDRVTSRVVGWDEAVDALADPPTKLVIER